MAIDLGGVKFSIKVGTGRSASNTKKVADELERLVAVTAKLRKEQGRSAAAHGKYDGSTRKVDHSSRRAVASTTKWADAVNVLAGAFASLQISKLVDASVKLAGRADVMQTVLFNVGKTANYSAGELSLYESQVKSLGATTLATRSILTRFAQNNLDVADAARITRIAQDAAVIGGINSSEAAERMTVAISRLDTEMLRNVGILVNLPREYSTAAAAMGRTVSSLSAAERQQILLNAVIARGSTIAGNYDAALGDVFKRAASLDRKIEEFSRSFGEQFLPLWADAIDAADRFLDWHNDKAPDALRTTEAVLASMGVAFVGLSTAAVAANLAMRLFAGGNALAAASTAANVASTNLLTAALTRLKIAALANPLTAAAVVVGTTVAGAAALISSLERQAEERRKQQRQEAEQASATAVAVRDAADEVERLAKLASRDDLEESRLQNAMADVIALSPQLQNELVQSTDDAEKFLDVLRSGSDVDLTISNEEWIAQLESRRDALQSVIASGKGDVAAATAELEGLEPTIRSATDTLVSQQSRLLEESNKNADTALALAGKLSEQLKNYIADAAGDAGLKATRAIREFRDQLTVGYEAIETIEKRFDIANKKSARAYEDAREAAFKEHDGAADLDRRLAEAEKARVDAERKARQGREADEKRRADTLKAFTAIREQEILAVGTADEELQKLERRFRSLGSGIDSGVLTAIESFEDQSRQAALAARGFDDEIDSLNDSIAENSRLFRSAKDKDKEGLQRNIQRDYSQLFLTQSQQSISRRRAEVESARLLNEFEKVAAESPINSTIESTTIELENLRREIGLIAQGATPEFIALQQNLADSNRQASATTEELTNEFKRLKQAETEITEKLRSGDVDGATQGQRAL